MKFLLSILLGLSLWLASHARAQNSVVPFVPGRTLAADQLNIMQKGLVSTQGGASTNQSLATPTLTGPNASGGNWLGAQAFGMNGTQTIASNPVGIGPLTVQSSLYINDTVTDPAKSAWPNVIQTTSRTGYGQIDPIWNAEPGRINLFLGMDCEAGSAACWTANPMLYLGTGFQASAHGIELDVENNSSDRDGSVAGTKPIVGFEITGASQYQATYGIDIVGGGVSGEPALFHSAIGILSGAASDNSFFDVSSSTEVFHVLGTHGIGLDTVYANISGATILLNSTQHVDMLNTSTKASWTALSSDGMGVIVGSNAPHVLLGYGGGNGFAFLGVTDNTSDAVVAYANGNAADIDIDLQPKGAGVVNIQNAKAASLNTSGTETATSMVATSSFQMPVVSDAPAGSCISGKAVVGPAALYVCVSGAWKTATLQ